MAVAGILRTMVRHLGALILFDGRWIHGWDGMTMKLKWDRRTALKSFLAGGAIGSIPWVAGLQTVHGFSSASPVVDPAKEGITGDGATPVAAPLQRLLDRLSEEGGGIALLPPGRYLLEKTLLVPSLVHLVGHGASTVLTGQRPPGVNGFALLANAGITTKERYDGAHDFSVQNLALDSPRTNGIVLVHAENAFFSHIHGLDAHHHHFDIAGSRNIICVNLYLTGRSGTAPFQIDGSPFNNNIWDGTRRVAPIRDNTPNDGIFLSQSVIRPTNRPNHGIHLHRRGGKNIFIDNVLVEHVENGIYRDPDCQREDVVFSNVVIRDVSHRGVDFQPSNNMDRRITFENTTITGCASPASFEYHAGEEVMIQNLRVDSAAASTGQVLLENVESGTVRDLSIRGNSDGVGLLLRRCRHFFLSRIRTRGPASILHLEDCGNILVSGLMSLGKNGEPLTPRIIGEEEATFGPPG